MASEYPSFLSTNYQDVCRDVVAGVSMVDDVPVVLERLEVLGQVVGDFTLAGRSPLPIDPSGDLGGLDDDELVDWWTDGCWVRDLVWAGAASGRMAPVDWLLWMIRFAELGYAAEFRGHLADDLRDVSRVAMHARESRTGTTPPSHRSPTGIVHWLTINSLQVPSAAERPLQPTASTRIRRAWLNGELLDAGQEFDALLQTSIAGTTAMVVEFDEGHRRHVIVPIESTDPRSIDSDYYCIDLICHRCGWLSPTGGWTWDNEHADQQRSLTTN